MISKIQTDERRHETPLRFTQETPSNDIIMKKKLLDEQRKRYINSLIPARDSSKRVNLPRIIGSDSDQKMINYKAGGNLPKYQGDLYSTSEIQPITTTQVSNPYTKNVLDATVASVEAPKQKTKNNMGQVAGYAQLAAGVLDKYIPKTERDYGGSEEHYQAMKNMQTGEQDKMHQTVDSMVPVWGAVHGATRTVLDAVDQKDEYGRSKSKAAHVITNFVDPSRVLNIAIDDFKKGDAATGFMNLATAGLYGQYKMDETKEAVDKQLSTVTLSSYSPGVKL